MISSLLNNAGIVQLIGSELWCLVPGTCDYAHFPEFQPINSWAQLFVTRKYAYSICSQMFLRLWFSMTLLFHWNIAASFVHLSCQMTELCVRVYWKFCTCICVQACRGFFLNNLHYCIWQRIITKAFICGCTSIGVWWYIAIACRKSNWTILLFKLSGRMFASFCDSISILYAFLSSHGCKTST